MASETESLNLVVNLTDNASAGLAKLRGELSNLGSGQQTQNLQRFRQELSATHKIAHDLAGEFISLSRAVPVFGRELSTGLTGVMGMLGPVGLGVAAVGGAVAAVILEVNKLATELRNIRNISNIIGIEPATLKTFQDRAREVGVSAEVVTSSLHGMRNALAELYKPAGGTLRATVLAHTRAGQIAETEQFLEDLKGMTDEQGFKAIMHRAENVRRHALERTRTAGRPGGDAGYASQRENEYLAQFGIDPNMRLLGDKFKEMSAEDRKAYNERNEAGAKAADAASKLGTEVHRVGEELFAGTNLMNNLTAATRVLTNVLKLLHPGALPSSVTGAATGAKYGSWLGPVGTAAGAAAGAAVGAVTGSGEEKGGLADQLGVSGIPKGSGPAGAVEPQYFSGGGIAEGMRLSSNIEDRRGEHDDSNKLLADNTAQLKRIADMMELSKAEGSQLNFGPANVVGPGAPGTQGGGFGDGGGGGGLGGGPYGNTSGPGTGTGAGSAPLQPGLSAGHEPFMAPSGPGGGKVGWWTPERANHAVQKLVAAGFPEVAAKGMVARWAFEAPKGPGDINRRSGAYGIAQWLGSRKPGALASGGDFDKQIDYAIRELKGPEARAARMMRAARTPEEAAAAASAYERAERPFIGATLKNYNTLFGGRAAPPISTAPLAAMSAPQTAAPISTAPLAAMPTGDSSRRSIPIRIPAPLGSDSGLVIKQGDLKTGAVTPPLPIAADRGLVIKQGDLTTGELANDRRTIDRQSRQSVKVDATGNINADIRAPKNAENTPMEGLFRNTEPNRQAQMTEAHRGPVDVQPAAPSGF